jgi:hypothetical protein
VRRNDEEMGVFPNADALLTLFRFGDESVTFGSHFGGLISVDVRIPGSQFSTLFRFDGTNDVSLDRSHTAFSETKSPSESVENSIHEPGSQDRDVNGADSH